MNPLFHRGSYYVREGSPLTAMIYIYCKSTKMLSSYGLKGNLLYHSCFFDAAESEDETHLFSGFFMLVRLREKKDRW